MRRRVFIPCILLALTPSPALAAGSTGGAEAGALPIDGVASAQAGPVSVSTREGGLVGVRKTFSGRIPGSDAGRTVTIERYDQIERSWSAIAHATAAKNGKFKARWKPDRAGAAHVRARVEAPDASAASQAPELDITLYSAQQATWYGNGKWIGRKTACGETLSKTLMGVAHKKLPCGTMVKFLYKGRTVTVPVIDRGPYAKGRSWDLTYAAAKQLNFLEVGTDTVGALPQVASK